MNKKNLKALAAFIKKHVSEENFNMNSWMNIPVGGPEKICKTGILEPKKHEHACGTTACLAGWEMLRQGYCLDDYGTVYKSSRSKKVLGHAEFLAAESLGLDDRQKRALFAPGSWPREFNPYDGPMEAVKRIKHMIETGE